MMKQRIAMAGLVGALAFGGVFATASGLGGITGGQVGADNTTVTACDTDGVTTEYASTWDGTDKRYEIATVTVGGVADACDGKTVKVNLTDTAGDSLGEGTLSIPNSVSTSFSVTMSTAAPAKATEGVHVTIA